MTGVLLLAARFLLLAVLCTNSASATPPLTHYYDEVSDASVARMSGVYRVVDETSCTCRLIFLPCPVEVQKHISGKMTSQCPLMTRYCCQRATLINLNEAAQKVSTASSVDGGHISTASPSTPVPSAGDDTQQNECPGCLPETQDNSASSGSVPATSGSSGTQATRVESPHPETTTEELATQKPPPTPACSCMTKYECQSQWAAFKHMPKYDIKTSIRCKDAKQVVCCFGKIIPPRGQRSPSSSGNNRGSSKTPDATSIWETLENLMAYFNSGE